MSDRILGPTAEPELSDLLDDLKKDTMNAMNCIQIGTIQSYNPLLNTAKVSINFKVELLNGDIKEYPQLEDCPVFIMGGVSSYVSFPIAKGDTCIVLFNDKCIDDWYLTGEVVKPANNRSHSIADGIVLVGLRSIDKAVKNPANSICIEGGPKKVSIRNDDEDLKSLLEGQTTTLKSMIDTIKDMNQAIYDLITLIAQISVPSFGAPPSNASLILAEQSKYTGYKTSLDGFKTDLTTYTTNVGKLLDEGIL